MVILLSALAVVAAAILLVTWFVVGGGFALIYAAMGLAVASMLLLWAARWIGSTPEAPPATGPDALDDHAVTPVEGSEPARDVVAVSAGRPEPADPDPPGPVAPAGSEPAFPIAGYDALWVSQIVPLLDDLDPAELAVVDARERGGRHRAAVLDAIAERLPAATAGVAVDPGPVPDPGSVEADGTGGEDGPDPGAPDELGFEGDAAPTDPFGALDPEAQAEEDRLWAAAAPLLSSGRDPFLDDGPPSTAVGGGSEPDDRDDHDDIWTVEPPAVPASTPGAELDLGAVAGDAPATGPGPTRVRTFLGRRRSPVTVRRP